MSDPEIFPHGEPPAAAQPDEDDYDSAAFKDWTPEFTVWLVRRGKRFPMVVDSVFVREELAEKRAALLGKDEGWHAMKYSHIQPSAVEKPTGIIRRMDTPENREFWAFVERVAEEVRRERPSWAIEMTEKSQAVAPAAAQPRVCIDCRHPWHEGSCPVVIGPGETSAAADVMTCSCVRHEYQAVAPAAAPLEALRDMVVALKGFVEWHGGAHVWPCPEDDTCDCQGKPYNDAVNEAIRKAEVILVAPAAALSPKKLQRYDLQIAADQGRVFIEELKDDDGKWVKAADLESAAMDVNGGNK